MNELFALADSLEARFLKAQAFFGRLPAAILAKAFRSELVPQDESDESAAVLLERLRDAENSRPVGRARSKRTSEQLKFDIESACDMKP